jgi:RNA polymerase sigma-70 factor (ECF subfamily)
MVRDRQLAEDLSQETFIKALNAIGSYRPEFKFSSWIFKIANNAAIDHLRRRELDTLSLDGAPHAATPEEIEATASRWETETPLEELEARELGSAIERAIAQLDQSIAPAPCSVTSRVWPMKKSPNRSTCRSAR